MHNEKNTQERRVVAQLVHYWNTTRGDRAFPDETDIDPDALSEIWDNCFMVQARDIHHNADYNYSYLGNNIVQVYRGETINTECITMIGSNAGLLGNSFEIVLENKSPVEEDGEFLSLDGNRVQFRQCLLPLGDQAGQITAIFGGLSLRVLPKDEK